MDADIDIVDVVLHIDEALDAPNLQALEHGLRALDGVISVRFQTGNPHLALVAYNPARIDSLAILGALFDHPYGANAQLLPGAELHGELVGL